MKDSLYFCDDRKRNGLWPIATQIHANGCEDAGAAFVYGAFEQGCGFTDEETATVSGAQQTKVAWGSLQRLYEQITILLKAVGHEDDGVLRSDAETAHVVAFCESDDLLGERESLRASQWCATICNVHRPAQNGRDARDRDGIIAGTQDDEALRRQEAFYDAPGVRFARCECASTGDLFIRKLRAGKDDFARGSEDEASQRAAFTRQE